MNVALRRPMTVIDFLDWEARQGAKFEFDGIDVQAMTGGTWNHAAVQANLITALRNRLKGTSCQAFGSELKILVDGSVRYPDAFITCTAADRSATVAPDPVVVFEVVSPSTERIDRLVKNDEYRRTPSIQAYVILQPDFVGATMFQRTSNDWVGHVFGPGATLALPGVGIDLPLDELYEGLDLSA